MERAERKPARAAANRPALRACWPVDAEPQSWYPSSNITALIDAAIGRSVLREQMRSMLSSLPARQALLLQMRFGLGSQPRRALAEISRAFSLPPERIRDIEIDALRRLRAAGRTKRSLETKR